MYATRLLRVDFGLAALALVLALYSGLNELYFGKPFGTLGDYFEAITWGILSKALVEGVVVAFRAYTTEYTFVLKFKFLFCTTYLGAILI